MAARLQGFLDLFSVTDGGALEHPAVFGVEAADDAHPEALPRRRSCAVLFPDLVQQPLLLADPDADVLPVELQDQLLGLGGEPQLDCAGDHPSQTRVGLQAGDRRRIDAHRRDARNEVGDGELLDAVLAERRQDVRDVFHERPVRADDENAAPGVALAFRVDQPRGAVEADSGLAGAGAALDDERTVGRMRDQPVLVGLDRRDDVAHVAFAAPLQLFEQEVADARTVERGAVESLVGDVEQLASLRAEAAAERDALRILRRRRVERPRGGRLPVDDDLVALVVVHPAAADVERPLDRFEVEPAEEEAAFGVLEGREPFRRPGIERGLRDFAVGGIGSAHDDVAHPLEAGVGVVDVRLLRFQFRMAHGPSVRNPSSAAQTLCFRNTSGVRPA